MSINQPVSYRRYRVVLSVKVLILIGSTKQLDASMRITAALSSPVQPGVSLTAQILSTD
jgi:hypothetical protein